MASGLPAVNADSVRYLPPVVNSPKILCIGLTQLSKLWLVSAYAQLGQIDHGSFLRKGLGGEAKIHSKWARVTDNPRFIAQMREHYFEGLIQCGSPPRRTRTSGWKDRGAIAMI